MKGVYDQIFKQASKVFPPSGTAIAGGAVVQFVQAEDIDVFLVDTDWAFIRDAGRDLLNKLADEFAGEVTLRIGDQDGYNKNRMLLGTMTGAMFNKPIQVIGTTFENAGQLIDSFDLSVHAWALTPPHYLIGSLLKSTHKNEMIKVNRWDTPASTLARLSKLATRYGTVINAADVMKLEALIAQENR